MITITELQEKTKYYLQLNHINEIDSDTDYLELMWWIIENKLSEDKQMMLVYKMFLIEDETDITDTYTLFKLSRRQFYAKITKISKEINEIWKQL